MVSRPRHNAGRLASRFRGEIARGRVGELKSAPDLGQCGLLRTNWHQFEEHLPSDEHYRSVSAVEGRHDHVGGGRSGRRGAADRDDRREWARREFSEALSRWRKPLAFHDPAKVITDLAVTLALGGDWMADIALLRAEPGLCGRVASDATVSRTIDALAVDAPGALKAIDTARAGARKRAWALAGTDAPDHAASGKDPLIVDLDATLVASHFEKELA